MATSGRWSPNKVRKRLLGDTWVFPNSGMVLMRPTSIVSTGTSASATIGANGSVTFSACESLSLNGVFTTSYDNYMVVVRGNSSDDGGNLSVRLRTGSTDASGSNYTYQVLAASSTSVTGARATATYTRLLLLDDSDKGGGTAYIYGPFLAQPTAFRGVSVGGGSATFMRDFSATHSLSTSYESMTILNETSGQTLTGLISVYGLGG